MAKSARSKIVAILDRLWSIAIRAMYGNKCIICYTQNNLSAHHVIVRKAQSIGVRWLQYNGVPLCYVCHMVKYHGQQADKAWHEMFIRRVDELIPQDKQEEIRKIGHGITKYSISDLRDLVTTGWWNNEKEIQK